MAIYRNIHISFWTDTKVVDDFTPEDKYFMLYCLTNNYTNLCGCYEISVKQMSRDTGYNEETLNRLINRFQDIHKIIFYNKKNKELLIKNWNKYNWTKSEKLNKPLLDEIKNIKTLEFKRIVADEYNKRDTVSIPYIYPMDTTVSVSVTDTVSDSDSDFISDLIKKNNKQKIKDSNNVTHVLPDVTKCYTDIDIDKDIDNNIKEYNINKNNKNKKEKPTLEDINTYIAEKQLKVDGQKFFEYFEEGGWKDSKGNQVKNWKQKLLTWNRYIEQADTKKQVYKQRQYDNLDFLYKN